MQCAFVHWWWLGLASGRAAQRHLAPAQEADEQEQNPLLGESDVRCWSDAADPPR
jgi:hypothetical protein